MPVLRAEANGDLDKAPDWCELERYSIHSLIAGAEHSWNAENRANKLVVVEGACRVEARSSSGAGADLSRGQTFDVEAGAYVVRAAEPTVVVELGGQWGAECGGSGIFGVVRAAEPGDVGDPVDYPKHTTFDRHYHDCDEYWILVRGRGTASSEDVLYPVGPGDCVATRMGHHHDFPLVDEPVLAVFFETTMRGECRRGHLWEHTHGPATRQS